MSFLLCSGGKSFKMLVPFIPVPQGNVADGETWWYNCSDVCFLMAYLTWLDFSDLWMKPISLSRWDMALKESGLVWGDWRTTYGWGIKIDTNSLISFSIHYDLKYLTPVCSSPRMHLWKKQRSFMGTHWCWWRGGCLQRCVCSFE